MNKKSLRRDMPERLVKFLKKRKLLTKFLNNTVNGINRKNLQFEDIDVEESSIICGIQKRGAICYAFVWKNSPEGYNFWMYIHMDYYEEYDNDSNRV